MSQSRNLRDVIHDDEAISEAARLSIQDQEDMTSQSDLEKLIPRCETKDTDDFPELLKDEDGRCYNCKLWEAIEAYSTQQVTTARVDEIVYARHAVAHMNRKDAHQFINDRLTALLPPADKESK